MDLSNNNSQTVLNIPRDDRSPSIPSTPRQYLAPIAPSPYINSTPAHQYHGPNLQDHYRPYFFSQGSSPYGMPQYNSHIYGQPSPLFVSNPYLPPPPPPPTTSFSQTGNNFYDEPINSGSQLLDGMGPRINHHKEKAHHKDRKNKDQIKKGNQNHGTGAKQKQNVGVPYRGMEAEEFSDSGQSKNSDGSLRELLFDTLQQEVSALEVLRKQIAQFAIITQNAKKYCDMDGINPLLAKQGLLNINSPNTTRYRDPPSPPHAHHQPRGFQRHPQINLNHPYPPPPPAHMANYPRQRVPYLVRPAPPTRNPINIAFQTLYDVENQLKHCEKTVANKIEQYQKLHKVGDGERKENGPLPHPHQKARNPMNANDLQNMAYKTLQDIEKRLKVTDKDLGQNYRGRVAKEEMKNR